MVINYAARSGHVLQALEPGVQRESSLRRLWLLTSPRRASERILTQVVFRKLLQTRVQSSTIGTISIVVIVNVIIVISIIIVIVVVSVIVIAFGPDPFWHEAFMEAN